MEHRKPQFVNSSEADFNTAVAAGVLCGGASRRFGSDKAVAQAGDLLLGQRVIKACRDAGADPVMALGGSFGSQLGVPVLEDSMPGGGPLPAVAGALAWLGRGHLIVVPCDLPLLKAAHLEKLIVNRVPGEATVAVVNGRPEPSVALWPGQWSRSMRRAVSAGARSFRAGLELGPWHGVDLPKEALADADNPEDLERLLDPT